VVRAQTSIEYLLIIGLAVLAAAIVIGFIISFLGVMVDDGEISSYEYWCNSLDKGQGQDSNDCICVKANYIASNPACCDLNTAQVIRDKAGCP
jgi:hypothetical protein